MPALSAEDNPPTMATEVEATGAEAPTGTKDDAKLADAKLADAKTTDGKVINGDAITQPPSSEKKEEDESKIEVQATETAASTKDTVESTKDEDSKAQDRVVEASNTGKEDAAVDSAAEEGDAPKVDPIVKADADAKGTAVEEKDNVEQTAEQTPRPDSDGDAMVVQKPASGDEKKDEAIESESAKKTNAATRPESAEKVDVAEEKRGDENDAKPSKVRFGSVEEVATEENEEEYIPEEGEDMEDVGEGEEGEIAEDDEPTLDLQGLPKSLTTSLLERGSMDSPLHAPASKGEVDELRTLLRNGGEMEGKVDNTDIYDYTALHVAAEQDKLDVCKLLLEFGANIEASTKMHDSKPLHYAAFEGHDEIIEFLLEKGANINALTDDGRTPLYQASMRGHDHCVKLLLAKGADRNLADKDGKKPEDVADKQIVTDLLVGPPAKKARTE